MSNFIMNNEDDKKISKLVDFIVEEKTISFRNKQLQ